MEIEVLRPEQKELSAKEPLRLGNAFCFHMLAEELMTSDE